MINFGILGWDSGSKISSLCGTFHRVSVESSKLKDSLDELAESLLKAYNQMERETKSNNWLKMHGKPLRRGEENWKRIKNRKF